MSVIVSANLSNREDMENGGIAVKRSEGTCCISLDFKDWNAFRFVYIYTDRVDKE